jgi:Ca-activated chloride channel family protein
MQDTLPLAQKAARGLVRQLRKGDRAAVAGISSTVLVHQSMTPDLASVDAALRGVAARGETALYDALYIALRQCQQERLPSAEVRRSVIVLLTDGIDTTSHVTFEAVLDLVRHVQAAIYVVSLEQDVTPLKTGRAARAVFESEHAMSALARESGGRLFRPLAARELPAIYEAIGQELSSQYVIGYLPSRPQNSGLFRRISVGLVQPRGGIARTRSGYYADGSR